MTVPDPDNAETLLTKLVSLTRKKPTASEGLKPSKDQLEIVRLQAMLNAIPRPLWLRDETQVIIWCNETYAEFLNITPGEVITIQKEIAGQALKKKTAAPEEFPPGRALAALALQQNRIMETNAHAVVKGRRILMRLSEIPLVEWNMTIGIGYNNTREEELETELRRYQSSNRDLLGQLHSAIAIYTADEKIEFYNSAFSQFWSLEDQWLNTQPRLGEIMEKLRETRRLPEQSDFRRFKKSWLSMFTDLIEPFEDMLHLPDGTTLRLLAVPHSMGGLMMTFEDVTSRLQLESSYNTLIAVQKETLDNLAEAVSVYGGDGRLKLCNPAFSRLWNLYPEDLEGEPHIGSIVDKMQPCFTPIEWPQRREELIAKGLDRLMHEGRMERTDGVLVDFVTVPLPDGGVLVTYSDVTDKVRIENVLREKNTALEAAEQLKLDFLANVSYQLRTPLNAIMGFTEILENQYYGPLNERQKEYTHLMKDASTHLLNLINDILDLSTLEAGYMSLDRTEVELAGMLKHVYDLITAWSRKENVEIELKCPKNIGTIMADERRLQQAIINLVRNAIAYTPAGGKITLTAKRTRQGIQLAVSDTGIGISTEDRIRIFEPFERAQRGGARSRTSRGGAGIGLSLVRNIVALHGGRVELDSEPGQGTTVMIFLPFTSVKTDLKLPIGGK
ncbi:MAG: ATP-binding protein [Alphaproteobacteria bacterium]